MEEMNRCKLAVDTALRLAHGECKQPETTLKEISFLLGLSEKDIEKPDEVLRTGLPITPYDHLSVRKLVAAKIYKKLKEKKDLPTSFFEAWEEVKHEYQLKFGRSL